MMAVVALDPAWSPSLTALVVSLDCPCSCGCGKLASLECSQFFVVSKSQFSFPANSNHNWFLFDVYLKSSELSMYKKSCFFKKLVASSSYSCDNACGNVSPGPWGGAAAVVATFLVAFLVGQAALN